MPAAKTLRIKITKAFAASSLRNRAVRQVVKETELRGPRLEIGPLSASWVLEYRPQGLLEDVRRPFSKSYKFGDVHVRGFVHEVIIGCGNEIIARHKRSYTSADMIFDPLHFLPLLEQKVGALDQAAPLQGWDLPDVFATLHRLLEARMGKPGKREYVQVLRLLETFEMNVVQGAIQQAIEMGAIGYDAVKHLVLCRVEKRPPRLDLDFYPYLPKANVGTTRPSSYMSLMGRTAA